MLRDERDYVLRMIAATAAMVARLRKLLAEGKSASEIVDEARAAEAELIGKDVVLLRALDPVSAALMAGPERLSAWADLLDVEADALDADGRCDEADAARERAAGLRRRASSSHQA